MNFTELNETLKAYGPDSNIELLFVITAGDVTDGNFKDLSFNPTVSAEDIHYINMILYLLPKALDFPDVSLTWSANPQKTFLGAGRISAEARKNVWEKLFAESIAPGIRKTTTEDDIAACESNDPKLLRPIQHERYVRISILKPAA